MQREQKVGFGNTLQQNSSGEKSMLYNNQNHMTQQYGKSRRVNSQSPITASSIDRPLWLLPSYLAYQYRHRVPFPKHVWTALQRHLAIITIYGRKK